MAATMRLYPTFAYAVVVVGALLLSACKDGADGSKADGAEAPTDALGAPVRIAVQTVLPRRVVVYDELPGRVSARRTAEIRPQVNGIIQKVLFTEGTEVAADQPLFQIDAAPFAADVEAAAAILARGEADLFNATAKHKRVEALAAARIASPAALGDATATLAQARASVAEAKANLTRRELERAHATIRSPIAGRIGQALVTEGSLASVGAQTPLAVVQQIDRVYLDVRQPSMGRELLEEMLETGRSEDAGALPVNILTITGKPYAFEGRVLFSESTVDPGTGSIAMRVEVPNPDRQLLPGMYLRAKVPRAIYADALTVPQEAVRRAGSGRPYLTILVDDKTVANRDVELGALVDRQYVVLSGLKAGETVVVQGQARTEGGQPLELVRYEPAKPHSET
ncbi:efflux RND transporter periplasmic adaptor subunit [Segnochrobactrum spirostomi]|uniref:Efflux RND transporter periplasmic adaptor subunit n=1 Tax=Segnochrobactrum spirostomi TaxID=2608987 RepID=A0A6A7Y830_9HYPH|nr:efflux RND transporter periplasmic adaptor subunit [Segnochrobactrum spirostomi]MQT14855.1 efflux RND transporter periplasmic adaptor subunit [Segnochrobactrum spirostomi]